MRGAVLIVSLLAAVAGGVAFAQGVEADREGLALAKRQAQEAQRRSELLESQAQKATDDAARARAAGEALVAHIQVAEADISAAEARVRIVDGLARAQRARLAEQEEPVVRLTAALQNMARRPPALALVQPGSVDEIVRVRSLLASTLPVVRSRTAGLRAEVQEAARLGRQAEQARQALVASREQLRQRRVALARFEAEQRQRSAGLLESAVSESDRALALGEEARQLARLVETRAFQERLEASLSDLPGPLPRPGDQAGAQRQGRYLLPVRGELLTGVGEISDAGVHARGLTFRTEPEASVVSPANGRVVYAGRFRSYGNVVIIDHGGDWTSVLTHLATVSVRPGAAIRRGQSVGRAAADDPRISVELRKDGRPVSITQLLG